MTRDSALDMLPKDYVWDLVDYIPRLRSAKLEGRGAWPFFTPSSFPGTIWGGRQAPFVAGTKLLVHAGGNLYDVAVPAGTFTNLGALFASSLQNGVMLRDRVYFADASGDSTPKYVTGAVAPVSLTGTNAPKAKFLARYKDRLVAAGRNG